MCKDFYRHCQNKMSPKWQICRSEEELNYLQVIFNPFFCSIYHEIVRQIFKTCKKVINMDKNGDTRIMHDSDNICTYRHIHVSLLSEQNLLSTSFLLFFKNYLKKTLHYITCYVNFHHRLRTFFPSPVKLLFWR